MNATVKFVLNHKLVVGIVWLVILIGGLAGASHVQSRLSQQFTLPGQKSFETNRVILQQYGNGADQAPMAAVVHFPSGTSALDPITAAELGTAFAGVASDPHLRVASYANTHDPRFVSSDGRTAFALIFSPLNQGFNAVDQAPQIQSELQHAGLPGDVRVTGLNELASGGDAKGPGVFAETLFGGLGALIVLAFVFGSFIALVPMLIAIVSIVTTLLIVLALTTFTDVSFIVLFLVSLIGLGVAIDYSLLVVTRWREERQNGRENREAVEVAMEKAGHAVAFSGLTVAVGLLALVFLPVPFLRSVGYGGMLIPLVSVVVTMTLLPVILATVGPRLDWPRIRHDSAASRPWTSWARLVVRTRWVSALVALVILGGLAAAATGMVVGDPRADSLSKSGPAYEGLEFLHQAGIPVGSLAPIELLVPSSTSAASVVARAETLPGVFTAMSAPDAAWHRAGTSLVEVLPVGESSTGVGKSTILRVRDTIEREFPGVRTGGTGAQLLDFNHAVYGTFPLMLTFIAVLTFLLLARAFRSLLLPFKAVLLNLLSVGATYGALVFVWQEGHGSRLLFGVPATGSIASFIPLMIFAFLFGLSMDYEVFILARMREEYDNTHSTTAAIVEGIGRTGRLVTSAALILFLAFVSLASGPQVTIKVFATGLGFGILLDATIVRALLVPALVSLFGKWNWYMPSWSARMLRVPPSPPREENGGIAEGALHPDRRVERAAVVIDHEPV